MITDYYAEVDQHQRERQIANDVERRRAVAERAVREGFDGDRLALIAHLARAQRATRAVAARPVSC